MVRNSLPVGDIKIYSCAPPKPPHSFLGVCHLPTHWPYADLGGYNPKKWPSKRQLSGEAEPPKVGQNNGCTGFDNPL